MNLEGPFHTWVKTVSGVILSDGQAQNFDAHVSLAYEELRGFCENGEWIPTNVAQSQSTNIVPAKDGDTDLVIVCTVTAQLVKKSFVEAQQRAQMLNPNQPNGFRR